MIKVIIISGFLGAGKTTLIKKILNNQNRLGKVMLLENEFGEIGIDGHLLKNTIEVKEINNGCICCSLEGKLEEALDDIAKYDIETLIVEPSGVAKLSEIIKAFEEHKDFEIATAVTMIDVTKAQKYHKNFREFYDDQIGCAEAIILSRADISEYETIKGAMHLAEDLNEEAIIVTTPLNELTDDFIFDLLLNDENKHQGCIGNYCDDECCCDLEHEACHCHDEKCNCDEHDEHCSCHENGEECHCHDHGECHCEEAGDENCICTLEGKECHCHDEKCDCDEHDEHCSCHENGEECHCHDHGEDCGCDDECHCHEHHHDEHCSCHHHNAKDTFMSVGFKTARIYSESELSTIINNLPETIIRAKGILKSQDGWLHFEFTPGESYITKGETNYTGLISVIGTELDTQMLKELFKLND